ncbi:MAG: protein kinase [Myxococcales bacterium]|nr:protein kinase [Myxococcales bacterium]
MGFGSDPARDLPTHIAAERVRAALFGISRPPRFRRYLPVREIGRGGQGVVFSATDPALGRDVALKLVEIGDATQLHRVLREAQLLARLSHPNIATLYDVGTADGTVFMALELVTGRNVQAWLAAAPRRLAEILDVMDQIAQALAFAHAAQVLHCDVKPQNVLVGDDGRVRMLDFGLARLQRSVDDAATPHDAAVAPTLDASGSATSARGRGTPAYAAPEVWQHEEPTAASDQFSYFVMFYEALFGHRPLDATPGRALLLEPERRLEFPRAPAIPRWLRALVARGLAADPAARHASMQRVESALRRSRGTSRPRTIGGLAGLGAVAMLAAWPGARGDDPPPCHGLRPSVEVHGEASTQAGIDAQLAPIDARTAEHALGVLDDYAAHLEALRTDACAQTVEVTRLRLQCLDELALAHGAALDLIAQGSIDSAAALARVLDGLAEPEACSSGRATDGDPEVAAGLARARMLTRAGHPQDAYATAVVACAGLSRRDDASWAGCVAEQGMALAVAGRETDAQPLLEEAFTLASALALDDQAFRLAEMLATQATERRDEPDARRWIGVLNAHAARTDRPRSRFVAGMVEAQYLTAFDAFDDAIARLERLLDDPAAALYTPHERLGLDTRLGSMRGRVGDVAGAHRAFDHALTLVDDVRPGDPLVPTLHAMRAQQLGLEGRYDEALASFRLALESAERDLGDAAFTAIHARDGIADALMRLGRVEEALPLAEENVRAARSRADVNDKVYTLKTRSSVLVALQRLPEARADALEALTIAEAELGISATTRGARMAYATVLVALGELDLARSASELVVTESVALFGEEHPETMAAVLTLANVEAGEGNHRRAIDLHRRAKAGFRAALGDQHPNVALEAYNLAESHLATGDTEAALREADEAHRICRETLGDDHQDTRDAVELLARVRAAQGR